MLSEGLTKAFFETYCFFTGRKEYNLGAVLYNILFWPHQTERRPQESYPAKNKLVNFFLLYMSSIIILCRGSLEKW